MKNKFVLAFNIFLIVLGTGLIASNLILYYFYNADSTRVGGSIFAGSVILILAIIRLIERKTKNLRSNSQ